MKRFFYGQSFKTVSPRSKIIRAVSNLGDDCFLEHPVYDPNYNGGSSNGQLFTSRPLPGQKGVALKNNTNGGNHFMVINNVHSGDMIEQGQFKGFKQGDSTLDFIGGIGNSLRYLNNDNIFLQDSKGSRSLDISYNNLTEEKARELGFDDGKIKEIGVGGKEFNFSSQSEKDLFLNSFNKITEDDLGNTKFNEFKYRMDTRNIPNDKNFTNLKFKDQVVEMHTRDLYRNDSGLTDDEIVERVYNRNVENYSSNFETENN